MCQSMPKRRCVLEARRQIWNQATSCFEPQLQICGQQEVSSRRVPTREKTFLLREFPTVERRELKDHRAEF